MVQFRDHCHVAAFRLLPHSRGQPHFHHPQPTRGPTVSRAKTPGLVPLFACSTRISPIISTHQAHDQQTTKMSSQ